MNEAAGHDELAAAAARGDHDTVLRLANAILAERPGDDAAHELRARSLLAHGRLAEAEVNAQAAVRLDPDEVRYRELLAQILARTGAHREAADEYALLARRDPRQGAWIRAEAAERLAAGEAERATTVARQALRLDSTDAAAQLTLARGLLRAGQAGPAREAARRAVALAPADPEAREVDADAAWLAGEASRALADYADLARGGHGAASDRAVDKARAIYRDRAGLAGRLLAASGPLFAAALRSGRLRIREPRSAPGDGGSAAPPPARRG